MSDFIKFLKENYNDIYEELNTPMNVQTGDTIGWTELGEYFEGKIIRMDGRTMDVMTDVGLKTISSVDDFSIIKKDNQDPEKFL